MGDALDFSMHDLFRAEFQPGQEEIGGESHGMHKGGWKSGYWSAEQARLPGGLTLGRVGGEGGSRDGPGGLA